MYQIILIQQLLLGICCQNGRCPVCIEALSVNDDSSQDTHNLLVKPKTNGGLIEAPWSVFTVCESTEGRVRRMLLSTNQKMPKISHLNTTIAAVVLQEVIEMFSLH